MDNHYHLIIETLDGNLSKEMRQLDASSEESTYKREGQNALQFQRQLGIKRYETAFLMLHKLRAAMVQPGRDRIGAKWSVEVDETFIGGATQ